MDPQGDIKGNSMRETAGEDHHQQNEQANLPITVTSPSGASDEAQRESNEQQHDTFADTIIPATSRASDDQELELDVHTLENDHGASRENGLSPTAECLQGSTKPPQQTFQYPPDLMEERFEQAGDQQRPQQQREQPLEEPADQRKQEAGQLNGEQQAYQHEPALRHPKRSDNREPQQTDEGRPQQRSLLKQPPENCERPHEDAGRDGLNGRSRRAKKQKPSKRATSYSSTPACQDGTELVETLEALVKNDTPAKRATEVLFDRKTATALRSLCALQQQAPTIHLSGAQPDVKELEELEHSFSFAEDAAQTLERERIDRLQRIESLRTVAILRQNITTEKAIQGLQAGFGNICSQRALKVAKRPASFPNDKQYFIKAGQCKRFVNDTSEARRCIAAEVRDTYKQQEERLQSQADRLRQQAQAIHDRIMQQVKQRQAQFKVARKSAAHAHLQRMEEMSRTLQSLQMRLEAIFQHRCLNVLKSYGFLKRDLCLTDFSLKQKVPRAASRALGFKGGNEEPKWRYMPQTVRLRLDMCRAVKDGVPRGQYVMMVSVWNKLGGHRLVWTYLSEERSSANENKELGNEEVPQEFPTRALATGSCAVSAPVAFAAMYFSECLRFDETVYFNCPSESDLRPSMCLVFQLYLLRGAVSPIDKVVAWGAFPLVGPEGRIVEGAFKVPLFLGEVDTAIQRYVDMEAMLRTGLDCWLCNFYFRIGRLPKQVHGHQEFEVPLHYTGRMLKIPHELPPPKGSRRASSLRSNQSSSSSHSSLRSSIGRYSVQRIVRNMQPHRDTVDGT
ncbi:hypothetical protein Esti_004971 [Eimeria stiedai]